MERKKQDFVVGLFVVAGIAAMLMLALKVANLGTFWDSNKGYVVYAAFENIGGLKPRAPVKSAGVVVGRVAEVSFDTGAYEAVVALRIEDRYQFPRDTFASIQTSGLLGEQYVGLDAGGDTAMLKPNDRIQKTQSAIVLEKLIGQFLFSKAEGGGSAEEK